MRATCRAIHYLLNHPTGSTVLGGIALELLLETQTRITVLSWIRDGSVLAASFLSRRADLPYWLIGLLPLSGAAGVIVALLIRHVATINPYERYTRDRVFDLDWQWCWSPGGSVSELCALCPKCSNRIDFRHRDHSYGRPLEAWCNHCDFKRLYETTEFEDSQQLHSRVWKEIDRRWRTSEYRGSRSSGRR